MADILKTITLRELVAHPIRVPNPLTSFTAVEESGEIRLSWTDPDVVATHYDIEYSENNFSTIAGSVTVPAAPLTGSIYDWFGPNTAIDNWFRIKSRNASGSSAWTTAFYDV